MAKSSVACVNAGEYPSVKVATGDCRDKSNNSEVHKLIHGNKRHPELLTQGLLVKAISRALLDQDPDVDLDTQFNHVVNAADFLVNNVKTSGSIGE